MAGPHRSRQSSAVVSGTAHDPPCTMMCRIRPSHDSGFGGTIECSDTMSVIVIHFHLLTRANSSLPIHPLSLTLLTVPPHLTHGPHPFSVLLYNNSPLIYPSFFFLNNRPTPNTPTLPLHAALPI